jgi:site-specific DNA-cytosine methylase
VSKADQVKLIGNSVPPQLARAIAKANVVDLGVLDDAREAVPA